MGDINPANAELLGLWLQLLATGALSSLLSKATEFSHSIFGLRRSVLAICTESRYSSATEDARWHVLLATVDILSFLYADCHGEHL